MTTTREWRLVLMDDHQATEKVLTAVERMLAASASLDKKVLASALAYLTEYADKCHNRKEEDHLFPLIESRGIPREGGPLAVMLAEHEQSRALLGRLKPLIDSYVSGTQSAIEPLRETFSEYAALLKSHYWKENDILFPMALRHLSQEDGAELITGFEKTEAALGDDARARYHRLADEIATAGSLKDLSFDLDRDALAAILNTLPVELSFVDAEDTVRYFSHEKQDKIFPRTRGAIGMKVQNCHPKKSLHMVNAILADFKAGKRNAAEFWIGLGDRMVHIRYFAVHDESKRYIGCLEVVQDITKIQKLQGERRLLE
jgi:DUF438 domain-containing protein